jgi:transmembrane sensor
MPEANERSSRDEVVAKGLDELIFRSLNGRSSDIEEAQIEGWRRARRENEAYYRDLVALLEATRAVLAEEEAAPSPSGAEIIQRANRIEDFPESEIAGKSRRRGWSAAIGLGVAAGIATLLILSPFEREASPPPLRITGHPGALPPGSNEIVTHSGEVTTVMLSDGSVVRLGPDSRLRVVDRSSAREVWLEGRAYFAVSAEASRPFRIRTTVGEAVVLGTRFDLEARNEALRVLVVEGAVKLSAGGSDVTVGASELGRVRADVPPVRELVDNTRLERELQWLDGFIVFENTPLAQVARELTAQYGVPIEILDDDLATSTVRGLFNNDPFDEVIDVVCRALSASCQISPNSVTISP